MLIDLWQYITLKGNRSKDEIQVFISALSQISELFDILHSYEHNNLCWRVLYGDLDLYPMSGGTTNLDITFL